MHPSITWFPCVFKWSINCVSTYNNNEYVKIDDDIHDVFASIAKKLVLCNLRARGKFFPFPHFYI